MVFSLVSSQGSASQEFTKFCNSSGSSLESMNAWAMSEKRVKGEYMVDIQ